MRHPAVAEAAAVGVPSELGEDDILLVVTLRPGRRTGLHGVARFLRCPDAVLLRAAVRRDVSELPKNVIGRIRKDLLRERGLKPEAWDRETQGYIVSR